MSRSRALVFCAGTAVVGGCQALLVFDPDVVVIAADGGDAAALADARASEVGLADAGDGAPLPDAGCRALFCDDFDHDFPKKGWTVGQYLSGAAIAVDDLQRVSAPRSLSCTAGKGTPSFSNQLLYHPSTLRADAVVASFQFRLEEAPATAELEPVVFEILGDSGLFWYVGIGLYDGRLHLTENRNTVYKASAREITISKNAWYTFEFTVRLGLPAHASVSISGAGIMTDTLDLDIAPPNGTLTTNDVRIGMLASTSPDFGPITGPIRYRIDDFAYDEQPRVSP